MSARKTRAPFELLPAMASVRRNNTIERDPITGKFILQPLPPELLVAPSSCQRLKDSGKKYSTEKRRKLTFQLQPLSFASFNTQESTRPQKVRKLEIPPEPPSRKSRNSFSRRSLIRTNQSRIPNPKRSFIPRPNVDITPLLNLEEVEESLLKSRSLIQGYPFRSPKAVPTKFNFRNNMTKRTSTSTTNIKPEISKQPTVSKNLNKVKSPLMMSRISEENSDGSFKRSLDNEISKDDNISINSLSEIIKNIIQSQENAFKEITEIFDKYKQTHKENISLLTKILESTNKITKPDNEILKNTTRLTPNNDLRTALLKKNLAEHTEQIESPRTITALQLYNSTRKSCPILNTPKLEKKANGRYIQSARQELSNTIFKQCMLLQDTPKKLD